MELDLSHPPSPPTVLISHTRSSQLTVIVGGEGGVGVRGRSVHAPTPQDGRVTDSDGGGRVRVGGLGLGRGGGDV